MATRGWEKVSTHAVKGKSTLVLSTDVPTLTIVDGVQTFRIPRELESVNVWNGRHWHVKHRISQAWEKAFREAIVMSMGGRSLQDVLIAMCLGSKVNGVVLRREEPRRVTIQRQAPSLRRFIKDDDNLAASSKPVLDALKRCGLIRDDGRKWCQLVVAPQTVSDDGQFRTVVSLESIP